MYTYQQLISFCETGEFYFKSHNVHGYRVDLFDYDTFKVSYKSFLPNKKELRGLAVVFKQNIRPGVEYSVEELNSSVFDVYIVLEKFWNVNEVSETQLPITSELLYITEKVDGSLINFIQLPNGEIVAKSKMSFISEQAVEANKIFALNLKIQKFVSECFEEGFTPIFEYISPFNQIVLEYTTEELRLLKVRHNGTGEYSLERFKQYNGSKAELFFNVSINELLFKCQNETNVEGWVATFENGQQVKFKTAWYFQMHGIFTNEMVRENKIIMSFLNNKLDDVKSVLTAEKLKFVEEIELKLISFISNSETEIGIIVNQFNPLKVVQFVQQYSKNYWFKEIMLKCRQNISVRELIVKRILKETYHLFDAKEFLNKIN